ncbi:MAG: PAS domain S-box protein, partial [Proteobacteria bacterium]|nr:PAS domain S-box protein [Pseudomonadota bacterium]
MTDRTPSRRELLGELDALRRRVAELEKSPRPDRGRSPGPDGEVDLGRDLIQSLPVPLVAISPQGRVLMMNAVALEALGYQSEEVEGLDFLTAFVPEADREKFAEVLRRMIDGQQPTVIESRVLDKGGRRRLWEIHGRLVLPGNGRPPYSCCVGIDVTERRRTEAALRESEARYRALGEDMPALICRFLPEGTLTFVNGEYAAYLAKEPEELLGENFFQFVPESDRQRIGDHWSSLDAGRPARTYEHEVVGGDGSMRWRQWTDRALFDEQGRIVEYQSIGLDVTERRRTEEALRQSERQYRGLFKNAPIGLFQTALDGRPLRANPFLVRMLGFRSPDEALEWTSDLAKDFYANPEDRARLVKMLSQDERVLDFEVDLRRRDGTVFAATISAQAIRRDDGAVSFLEGFVQNVSMRKRAESDRVLLATAIEQTSEVVIVTDREGLIRYVNPAFERVTGHNREEAWGRIPWDIMRPDQADDTSYRDLVQAVLRGEVWCGRIVGTHKSGRQHELEMTASPVRDSQGAVAGFVAVGRDVTYELTMERQLRQAQKME